MFLIECKGTAKNSTAKYHTFGIRGRTFVLFCPKKLIFDVFSPYTRPIIFLTAMTRRSISSFVL